MSKTVVAMFDNYSLAENATRAIKNQGFTTDNISIVGKNDNETTTNSFTTTNDTATFSSTHDIKENSYRTNDNISDGIVTGGILGGLAGLLIGAGSMMIPGLGIIAAAGPITGLISGAVTGGVVGGLVDLGIPENVSKGYESKIKLGKVLFSTKIDDDKVSQVTTILKNNGAVSVDSY